ncbi:hypothetical protein B6U91_00125, partial [Candidatus Pacearchaeota archaeon ex4484_71]
GFARKDFDKRFSYGIFFLVLLAMLVLFFGIFFYAGSHTGEVVLTGSEKSCGDGTFYDSCSLNKPYFCNQGMLEERASVCGCPEGMGKKGEFCSYKEFTDAVPAEFPYFLNGERKELQMWLYDGVEEYVSQLPRAIRYSNDEVPLRADFKLRKINDEIQRQAILPLVIKIENLAPNSKVDQARIAISLVQNIDYGEPEDYIEFEDKKVSLSNFPYQTLYSNKGSCEGKSELLVLLLREIGYGTALFYYPVENHEAVGIKCPKENSLLNSGYCFVESTSPSIITDNGGEYLGAGKLVFSPELVLISDGISLPRGLIEYTDAKNLNKLRSKSKLNIFMQGRLLRLLEKYGLDYSF